MSNATLENFYDERINVKKVVLDHIPNNKICHPEKITKISTEANPSLIEFPTISNVAHVSRQQLMYSTEP